MKLILEEKERQEETEVVIRYAVKNQEVLRLIRAIQACSLCIKGEQRGCAYLLEIERIMYIDSVDDCTTLHCDDGLYECNQKLYELEEMLKHTSFVRISKSCIVNTNHLIHVEPLYDGKFIATTVNKEELVINRHYVKAFKEVFGL